MEKCRRKKRSSKGKGAYLACKRKGEKFMS
ncbi:uncharacterized protein G2W53_028302 [Senna tora]|uniref:Uncharacterized protein n=1 Tax=Senna tora TaxID=362788 RepID=A0A834T353_9FABA|nr:uncharacterized protein G2W53_028302 [Senna tora]